MNLWKNEQRLKRNSPLVFNAENDDEKQHHELLRHSGTKNNKDWANSENDFEAILKAESDWWKSFLRHIKRTWEHLRKESKSQVGSWEKTYGLWAHSKETTVETTD